jgi:hypothetical protein
MDIDGLVSAKSKFSPRQCASVSDALSFDPHASTEGLKWIPVLEAPASFSAYHVRYIFVAALCSAHGDS